MPTSAADRLGRYKAFAASLSGTSPGVVIRQVFHSLMYGPQAAFVSEQFTARLRYTGSSPAHTFAGVITLVGLRLGRAVQEESLALTPA